MRDVVQIGFTLSEEREPSVIVSERVRLVEAGQFFRLQLPVVKILLGPSH